MLEETPTFTTVWLVKYIPENVPLWQGPRAAMPKEWYFKTETAASEFLEENTHIPKYQFHVSETLAVKYKDHVYPFNTKLSFGQNS